MASGPIFYGPLTSDFGQITKVKIFSKVGRVSRPINGSKLIFHMIVYLFETSRNIQEPWPHDLYFMVHWLRTLARLSRLKFLSKVESQNLLMLASYISYEDVPLWDQQEYTRAMTSWPVFHGPLTLARLSRLRFLSKVESQDLLMVASWYFISGYISTRPAGIYNSHIYFIVCWLPDFGRFSMVKNFVIDRFLSPTDGSNLIFH